MSSCRSTHFSDNKMKKKSCPVKINHMSEYVYYFLIAYCSKPTLAHGQVLAVSESGVSVQQRFCSSDGQCIVDSLVFFLCDNKYVLSGRGHSRCQGTPWYPSLPTCGKTFTFGDDINMQTNSRSCEEEI